jgi:hypothetical protein
VCFSGAPSVITLVWESSESWLGHLRAHVTVFVGRVERIGCSNVAGGEPSQWSRVAVDRLPPINCSIGYSGVIN